MVEQLKGQVVVGRTPEGEMYSGPDKTTDPHLPTAQNLDHSEKAQDRYTITYRTNTDGEPVIASIEGDGTRVQAAREDMERGAITDMQVQQLESPKSVEVHGVEFSVGGPAAGVVVDRDAAMQPEAQEFFNDMESAYIHSQGMDGVQRNDMVRLDMAKSHREMVDKSADRDAGITRTHEVEVEVDR